MLLKLETVFEPLTDTVLVYPKNKVFAGILYVYLRDNFKPSASRWPLTRWNALVASNSLTPHGPNEYSIQLSQYLSIVQAGELMNPTVFQEYKDKLETLVRNFKVPF